MRSCCYWLVLYWLKWLAKIQLRKIRPLIIGVTGSVGKTSTLKAIEAVLKNKYQVKVSEKANSETGLALNILGFPPRNYSLADWLWVIPLSVIKLLTNWRKYDIYLAEMGVDSPQPPKNMGYLLTIFKPQIGVFLNCQAVHSEAYDQLAKKTGQAVIRLIAEEKGKLIQALPKNGWAVLNQADPQVWRFKKLTSARVIGFKGQAREAALAVAQVLKLNPKQARQAYQKNFQLPPGRMNLLAGIKQTTLIDSSYNASQSSMLLGLQVLQQTGQGKKIAVLGDMRELGKAAKSSHQAVAAAADKTADVVVTVGPLMKQYFKLKNKKLYQFDNTYQAAAFVKDKLIKGGETILIKASQNTLFFEIIVKALMRHPEEAKHWLCRQDKFWEKKRQAIKAKLDTI